MHVKDTDFIFLGIVNSLPQILFTSPFSSISSFYDDSIRSDGLFGFHYPFRCQLPQIPSIFCVPENPSGLCHIAADADVCTSS